MEQEKKRKKKTEFSAAHALSQLGSKEMTFQLLILVLSFCSLLSATFVHFLFLLVISLFKMILKHGGEV